jgi:hypothetical protein
MIEYPANQVALAKVYGAVKGGPGKKNYREHLKMAEQFMDHLREEGFRIVPFPPLKSIRQDRPVKAKRTARKRAN